MTSFRRLTSGLPAVGLLLAALLGTLLSVVVLAAPAHAAERVITITEDGVSPRSLQVAAGDTLRFVAQDRRFAYRAQSTSDNWSFDSGPLGLLDGEYVPTSADGTPLRITRPGTYTYRVAEDGRFTGSVVLPAPATAAPAPAAPRPAASPAPAAAPRPASSPAAPSPAPAATGGAGSAVAPPLVGGGLGSTDGLPSPAAGGGGVALPPALAPPLTVPDESTGPAPAVAGLPSTGPLAAPAVPGDLRGARTSRGFGLPAALAAVLAAGVASLLVRLLLAEPAARLARTGLRAPAPAVTVD